MKLRTNDSAFDSEMNKSISNRGSVRSSLWSSLFSESNAPSDVAFYRRASWLEEYANQRAQYLDEKSVERRRIREENRPRLINYLIRLFPCTRPKEKKPDDNSKVQESDSSRTSLNSMLQGTHRKLEKHLRNEMTENGRITELIQIRNRQRVVVSRNKKSMSKIASRGLSERQNGSLVSNPALISLDQTYVCFDVEQPCDAKQELVISRAPSLPSNALVAFRIRTNAPTRYIVNPNSGLLTKDKFSQNIVLELVGNRFNPHHRLVVQAIQVQSESEVKQVWKSTRLQKELQIIPLELSTTLMNIDTTNHLDSESAEKAASLTGILEQSSRTGEERVKELIGLNAMLKDDVEKISSNTTTAQKLKDVLLKHLEQRKQLSENLKEKLKSKEEEYLKLMKKVESQESVLKHLSTPKPADNSNCVIS